MGRLFPGGRNKPRGLSPIVDDDDDNLICFAYLLWHMGRGRT
jgi:hypothetical protein